MEYIILCLPILERNAKKSQLRNSVFSICIADEGNVRNVVVGVASQGRKEGLEDIANEVCASVRKEAEAQGEEESHVASPEDCAEKVKSASVSVRNVVASKAVTGR